MGEGRTKERGMGKEKRGNRGRDGVFREGKER